MYEDVSSPTFTDEHLEDAIAEMRARGFHVYLTLALDEEDAGAPGRWAVGNTTVPGDIDPSDWPWSISHPSHAEFVADFWESYTEQAVYFGELAERTGVELYSLGTETDFLFRSRMGPFENEYLDQLQSLLSETRAAYSGPITYDMLCNSYYGERSERAPYLWEDVDFDVVGVSAYFPLIEVDSHEALPVDPTPSSVLEPEWNRVFQDALEPVHERDPARPIVFLEMGYTNTTAAVAAAGEGEFDPYVFSDRDNDGVDDGDETQANILQSFFGTRPEYLEGAFLWGMMIANEEDWGEFFGTHRGFAFRDHPGEEVVRDAYEAMAAD